MPSIAGNSYDANAKYVTSNLNLWPRPLVIVMGNEAYDSLTEELQSVLRDAAEAAIPKALEASRAEDEEAVATLCRRGMTFATASESDLAALRTALEPVYAQLTSDPETRSFVDAIASLKEEIAASAEAPSCASVSDPSRSATGGISEGTYEATISRDDWVKAGMDGDAAGVFTLEFTDGMVILREPSGEVGFQATYTLFRDKFEAVGDPDTLTARWSFDGTSLRFTDLGVCGGSGCAPSDEVTPYHVVWESHPWLRVEQKASPIDGVYEFRTTASELRAAGSPDSQVENYGRFRWVLDNGRFEMTQRNGASDRWTKGTYVVRDDVVVFNVEDYGGRAPNNAHEKTGEVFTYTWSLYRDKLTLGAVEGADLAGELPGQALDASRLDRRVDRNLGEEPSATMRRALHGEPAAQGLDAVAETAQAGASRWIGAADAVVGDHHDQAAGGLGDANRHPRRLRVLRSVRERLRAEEVDGRLDRRVEPADGQLELDR